MSASNRYFGKRFAIWVMIAAIISIPVQRTVTLYGTFWPNAAKSVFAGVEGRCIQVNVQHGAVVKAGETLMVLDNPDVEAAIAETKERLEDARIGLASRNERLSSRGSAGSDEIEGDAAESERAQYLQRIKRLEQQLAERETDKARLTIVAPCYGVITTRDPPRALLGRMVAPGQLLLHVVDPNSETWGVDFDATAEQIAFLTDRVKEEHYDELQIDITWPTRTTCAVEQVFVTSSEDAAQAGAGEAHVRIDRKFAVHARIDPEKFPDLLKIGGKVVGEFPGGHCLLGYWIYEKISAYARPEVK